MMWDGRGGERQLLNHRCDRKVGGQGGKIGSEGKTMGHVDLAKELLPLVEAGGGIRTL